MTIEEWRPIVGFVGLYEVSNIGRVRSVPHFVTRDYFRNDGVHVIDKILIKERILNPKKKYHHTNRKKGRNSYYLGFSLKRGDKYINKLLHRIIAEAFIPNPNNLPCIDHINGNPIDNSIENLKWCTYLENNNNPISLSRKSESGKGANRGRKHSEEFKKLMSLKMKDRVYKNEWIKNTKKVYQYSIDGDFIAEYTSGKNAHEIVGISSSLLSDCCNGKRKIGKGYIWSYVKLH